MSLGNIEEFKDKLKVTFAHPGPIEDLTTAYTPCATGDAGISQSANAHRTKCGRILSIS
ncbi:Uncharacterized protein FKW44_013608 [Caligus rogercresseyi]|uniref:Uncharacterized protein n=1 Tax=Caligus rogercresseyi TaxID=217165 RepID=A0A7T8GXT9_CALRO|nr:Uncharacterized protein FKW44_013608 [Caligus rogercresseyi]